MFCRCTFFTVQNNSRQLTVLCFWINTSHQTFRNILDTQLYKSISPGGSFSPCLFLYIRLVYLYVSAVLTRELHGNTAAAAPGHRRSAWGWRPAAPAPWCSSPRRPPLRSAARPPPAYTHHPTWLLLKLNIYTSIYIKNIHINRWINIHIHKYIQVPSRPQNDYLCLIMRKTLETPAENIFFLL